MNLARAVLAEAVETLTDVEVQRARAQLEAGLLMAMESAQGRADHMARSIEVFGRILPVEELLEQLRAVDAAAARGAGAALLDGPRCDSVGGRPALTRGVSRSRDADRRALAGLGLIDSGNGQKLERYGKVRWCAPSLRRCGRRRRTSGIRTQLSSPAPTRRAEAAGSSTGPCRTNGSYRAVGCASPRR